VEELSGDPAHRSGGVGGRGSRQFEKALLDVEVPLVDPSDAESDLLFDSGWLPVPHAVKVRIVPNPAAPSNASFRTFRRFGMVMPSPWMSAELPSVAVAGSLFDAARRLGVPSGE